MNANQFPVQEPVDLLSTGAVTPQSFGSLKQRGYPYRKPGVKGVYAEDTHTVAWAMVCWTEVNTFVLIVLTLSKGFCKLITAVPEQVQVCIRSSIYIFNLKPIQQPSQNRVTWRDSLPKRNAEVDIIIHGEVDQGQQGLWTEYRISAYEWSAHCLLWIKVRVACWNSGGILSGTLCRQADLTKIFSQGYFPSQVLGNIRENDW